ncbi:four helix bundle protein [Seonamhaeicola aphaedonensis]|uniref:Four helix bundle protein n=1 Tax=Seonamhaeicola aphaedonensis TaxID=1461338 RepID=A0A3D9HIR0_9FLAO|nr:four helix bundle protein [Seonamhaeicola aphaedonensis]RED49338.1 four helix bundle protein [Seonamhaeicola aphaedonensis]
MTEDQNDILEKFKFEKLIIWQKSIDFGEEIDKMADTFPEKEKFNLSSQIRRAADSIALNISEGSIGQSNPEQKKFIGYGIRSLAEVVTCLFKAERRNYISNNNFIQLYNEAHHLMNMMLAFRKNIK